MEAQIWIPETPLILSLPQALWTSQLVKPNKFKGGLEDLGIHINSAMELLAPYITTPTLSFSSLFFSFSLFKATWYTTGFINEIEIE